ncbi:MAG TPA: mannose-1-phosphate guanylyltransferase [Myxococcales bacterium]|nr:mannose-1-phosphate guanylyltransferase [Myxococcales bacterium]
MNSPTERLVCAVMAGGSGTRFWPMSRRQRPKQLLALMSGETLLAETLARIESICPAERALVITAARLVDSVREQLPDLPASHVIGEPVARNTAPCFELAAILAQKICDDAIIALLPADHHIGAPAVFRQALTLACEQADKGHIVTLGVVPSRPETGYGYIELSDSVGVGTHRVERFVEKPDLEKALQYLRGGQHLWNAGVFVVRADVARQAVRRHLPALSDALEALADCSPMQLADGSLQQALNERFESCPSISVDYGVMEHEEQLYCVTLDAAWSDVGTWQSLLDHRNDSQSNYIRGDVLEIDCEGSVLVGEGVTVAALGLRDTAVVATEDAVLVMPVGRSQDVRAVVDALKDRKELL